MATSPEGTDAKRRALRRRDGGHDITPHLDEELSEAQEKVGIGSNRESGLADHEVRIHHRVLKLGAMPLDLRGGTSLPLILCRA